MEIEYKNWDLQSIGKLEIQDEIFKAPLRKDLIARVINWQRAKSRSGTSSTKTISMISGTTRKPWAQKETGRARQGSLRSPQFRGGAVIFGPHPRSYEYKLNKKVRKFAQISTIASKLSDNLLYILDDFNGKFAKTKEFDQWMRDKQFKSVLFVCSNDYDMSLRQVIANVPYCDILPVCGVNVLDVVKHQVIIFDLNSIKNYESRFATMGKEIV